MKIGKTSKKNFITLGSVTVVFILLTVLNSMGMISSSIKGQLVPICAYIIMAVSLNLTVGILGELSLGHAGFMSVGAFTGVIATTILKASGAGDLITLLGGLIVGGICAAIVGFLICIPVLRLRGDYFAIVALAFGEIIKSIFTNCYVGYDSNGLHASFITGNFTLEEGGKMIIDGPNGLNRLPRLSDFTIGFVLVMLCLIVVFNLVKSRTGRAVMAVRDNKIAAESVGINVVKYKAIAFTISAAMAGVAGMLYAGYFSSLRATKFDFNLSILVLVFVVLGGLGNLRGSIIAATFLTLLPVLLLEFSNYNMLVYAIVLIIVMLTSNNEKFKAFAESKKKQIKGLIRSPKKEGSGK